MSLGVPYAREDQAGLALASDENVATPAGGAPRQRRHGRSHRLLPLWLVPSAVWLGGVAVVAVCAPAIAPHDPTAQSLAARLTPPMLWSGSATYLLGTDHLGRDLLSRVVFGSRASLGVAVVSVVIGTVIGGLVGLLAGYRGGLTDEVLMALADIKLAFPTTLLAIAVIAVVGPSLVSLVVVLGVTGWVTHARIVRGSVLKLRSEEFIEAVKSLGGRTTRIMMYHILPNCLSPVIVVATLDMARIIIVEATLSFLGLGIQPPLPSWGRIIAEGRDYVDNGWWIAAAPGLALLLTTMSISQLGDWFRDVLDPTVNVR
jgi:peptide/nickel transport system permease protein